MATLPESPAKEQKAIVIQDTATEELNKLLSKGWKIIKTCPMPSSRSGGQLSAYSTPATCLVIIEKIKGKK